MVFPNPLPTPEELEAKYPPRNLPEGAEVTRVAPSPTGFMHVGTLYGALIDERTAHLSGGIFMLRLEDTDQKREVKEAVDLILQGFHNNQITNDEGPVLGECEKGNYGPYFQSARKEIYQAYAKHMISIGKAYPCFATAEELDEMRAKQEAAKVRPGYYGVWAKYRNLSIEEAVVKLIRKANSRGGTDNISIAYLKKESGDL